MWNAHESCQFSMADVQSVKVQEGYVVTSWGTVHIEGVNEWKEDETLGAVDGGGDEGCEGDVTEKPVAKRQKVVHQSEKSAQSGNDAAIHAAMLGLSADIVRCSLSVEQHRRSARIHRATGPTKTGGILFLLAREASRQIA
jgi:hypothetical protein